MIVTVGLAVITLVFLAVLLHAIRRDRRIEAEGIETEAVVSRVEVINHNSPGDRNNNYEYYAAYVNAEGRKVEGRIINARRYPRERDLAVGTGVKVKYLPGKEKNVMKIEE